MVSEAPELIIKATNFDFKGKHFDPISESVSASWNSIDIAGRSGPLYTYQKTEGMSYSFSIHLFAGGSSSDNGLKSVGDVEKKIKEFKSLVYPKYQGGITQPPRLLSIVVGNFLNFDGIATQVSVERQGIYNSGLDIYAIIKLDVNKVMIVPKDYNDIISEG